VKGNRHEIWYELFYDLIFVAACGQIGDIIKYNVSFVELLKCAVLFAVLRAVSSTSNNYYDNCLYVDSFIQTWDDLMFYQNRFDTKDMLHYIFYLFQALCAFFMACHLTIDHTTNEWDKDRNLKPFAVGAAIARISHSFMYSQILEITTTHRIHIFVLRFTQGLCALLYVLSAYSPHSETHYIYYWVVALFIEREFVKYILNFALKRYPSSQLIPWHVGHLISRQVSITMYSSVYFCDMDCNM
jgi:low temperature requirement protein LtrA